MKSYLWYLTVTLFLCSCSELEKTATNAARQTGDVLLSRTIRKTQNKIEDGVEKTIDNIGKKKKIKKSPTDSTDTVFNNYK